MYNFPVDKTEILFDVILLFLFSTFEVFVKVLLPVKLL